MPQDWFKVVLSVLASFGTTALAVSETGAKTSIAVIAGIVAAANAVTNLHVDVPGKVSVPKNKNIN